MKNDELANLLDRMERGEVTQDELDTGFSDGDDPSYWTCWDDYTELDNLDIELENLDLDAWLEEHSN